MSSKNLVTGLLGAKVKVNVPLGHNRRGEVVNVYLAKDRRGKTVPHYTVKVDPVEGKVPKSELWDLVADEIEVLG
jgi:hypothetical protein